MSRLLSRADLEEMGYLLTPEQRAAYDAAYTAQQAETATFDPSWADGRPLCHVCRHVVGVGEAIILPTGRHAEDDEELVGVLVHRRCPGQEGEG